MNKRVIKILTCLNYLQTVPVFLLIPFILMGGYGPYMSSPQDSYGVVEYTGGMVPLVIIAAFPVIYLSSRTFNKDLFYSLKDIKCLITPFAIILLIVTTADCVITFLLCGKETFVVFSVVSLFLFLFFNMSRNLILQLSQTKIYYIGPPAWIMALPFSFFILFGFIIMKLPEKYNNLVAVDLILCGLFLVRITMLKSYQIAEENKQIIYEDMLSRTHTIAFSQIKSVRRDKFYYIMECKNASYKVIRVSANIKKFRNTLKNNGIEVV